MSSFVAAIATDLGAGELLATVIGGAATGGLVSAVTGGNIVNGMLMGAATAGIGNVAGGLISGAIGTGANVADLSDVGNLASAANQYAAAGYSAEDIAGFLSQSGVPTSTAASIAQDAFTSGGALTGDAVSNIVGQNTANLGNFLNTGNPANSSFLSGLQAASAKNPSLLSAGGNLLGSVVQANAVENAAATRAQAAAQAGQQQLAIYNQQQAAQAPWLAAGQTALGQLSAETQPGGQFNKPFTMADAQNMPAYQFALQQGKTAMGNQAAMGGQQLSANTTQGIGTLAEGLASQYEQQAFNQNLAQNQFAENSLQSLAGLGQTAVQTGNTNLTNLGNNQAASTVGSAGATAAGQQGVGQIVGQAIPSLTSSLNQMFSLSNLLNPSPTGP
jgi:hypothetical protein